MQCGMMRLGKYDLRFVTNLHSLANQKISITSNQVALFDKLVEKYKRQLLKHEITQTQLSQLNWESTIIQSDPKFTEAYIYVEDDNIIFKSPFSKKFVDEFSKIEANSFKWIKEKKAYKSAFSTQSLKNLVHNVHRHYPIVNYCPITASMLNTVAQFSAKYWEPTLIRINDQFMIAAINDNLADAIIDIELSADPECLTKLAWHGIAIDADIVKDDPLLNFSANYIATADFKHIDEFIQHLLAIKCDAVLFSGQGGMIIQYRNIVTSKMREAGIIVDDRIDEIKDYRIAKYSNPVLICMSSQLNPTVYYKFKKVVKMRNSLPVTIK